MSLVNVRYITKCDYFKYCHCYLATFVFTGIFETCRWKEVADKCCNSNLPRGLFSEVKDTVLESKEQSTVRNYSNTFNRFVLWCKDCGFSFLPASPVTVALYLVSIIQMEDVSCSKSKLSQIFYSVNWAHLIGNLDLNPCDDKWLKLCLEGCIRKVAKPVIKKEPITLDILKTLVSRFASENCSLGDLRIITLFIVSFAGFLRISEALNLKRSNIEFCESYCSIYIEKSKTDIYRDGQQVVLAKTGNITCPVNMLHRYITAAGLLDISDQFIFRAVIFCRKTKTHILKPLNKALSYTRTRELFIEKLSALGIDPKKFGLHSFRSGAATISANLGTEDRLWKKHGRWRSDVAKDGYVKDTLKDRLSVSLNLDL